MSSKSHPYHILELSPMPILTSLSLFFSAIGGVLYMHDYRFSPLILAFGLGSLITCLFLWWKDVIKEALIDKAHTQPVQIGIKIGMGLFILSEIVFFAVFFSSFFKAQLAPVGMLDGPWVTAKGSWPPEGIKTFNPWDLPFINTLILLLSGTTLTWAHYSLIDNNIKDTISGLGYTILLGILFTTLQAFEYLHAPFSFDQGIYASNFYMATGFHGLHVIIGTIFLAVCYFRTKAGHFSNGRSHIGFELAAWYWHFVDVVWIFLFMFVYVLGR